MAEAYDFRSIEAKWQKRWEDTQIFLAREDSGRTKYYVLEMLPYPSGDLHVGHAKNYTFGDVVARMMRMLGYEVMHPMGWDAFGLPAENAAIARGADPNQWTRTNIANMQRQVRLMGTGYDWSREITTCDPEYYRWNQWLFLRLYEQGLAYKREAPVNWCPHDRTVLANEQVIDGRCWRCETLVERRNLSQWFLKITAYAQRLLDDLEKLDGWPERTRAMQRNWIGRSEGAEFWFAVEGSQERISVFTTRLDTLFGATYVAIAPEHPAVAKIVTPEQREAVARFAKNLQSKSELERTSLLEKEGVPSGAYAIHPLSHERIPIWVTNYVLAEYGTGAVGGVPAHDQRDFEFAHKYNLPIVEVIVPPGQEPSPQVREAYIPDGVLINSGEFDGTTSAQARKAIARRLSELGVGEEKINYKIRDWLISRQRYWGTPIPVVYCERCGEVPVPDGQLPVRLPPNVPITGEGSPLARDEDFVKTTCPKCGGAARRETDTMDTFFESSWYYLRYLDPRNTTLPWDPAKARYWMPIDQYIGGAEHAVLHLLYSRFFYKFFADRRWVSGPDEPFTRLFHQGLVLHEGERMSKSRGNVVGIDESVHQHGVDAMRLFLMYVTPPEDTSDWTDTGATGRIRFVNRVWRACAPYVKQAAKVDPRKLPEPKNASESALLAAVHAAAKSAIDETVSRRFHYNTTIAKFDEYVNALTVLEQSDPNSLVAAYAVAALPLIMAPFAPHIADELWERLGHSQSVHLEKYFEPDARALTVDQITLVVQVNGKVRARLNVAPGTDEEQAYALAIQQSTVIAQLDGKEVRKRIFVPDKLLNLVV
ncbi:MAG TPA: leucine--tRNA ligase [Candidatus Rubrimentiphilum sp.]|nr:leucine--tRNA ligase [Candidatus Rubrimentiphilum sp.]